MSKAVIVAGLGFGDEGKGRVVDEIVRKLNSNLVVRYNGGAQAAHNVITPEGYHHTFAQLGSGALAGARTLLSKFMLVNPGTLIVEADHLRERGKPGMLNDVYIDERAMITTPFHMALNRLRELSRGAGRHGSCGLGIGETMAVSIDRPELVIRAGDLLHKDSLIGKLEALRVYLVEQFHTLAYYGSECEEHLRHFNSMFEVVRRYELFKDLVKIIPAAQACEMIASAHNPVFEGAQGVLLDENYGFSPYTTWSTTTMFNAQALLGEIGPKHDVVRLGVARTYMTRHGPGPFPTECSTLTHMLPDAHNGMGKWQREFRCGWLDIVALQYALQVNGPIDALCVTHCDVLKPGERWRMCLRYERQDGTSFKPFPAQLDGSSELLTRAMFEAIPDYERRAESRNIPMLMGEMLNAPIAFKTFGPKTGTAEKGSFEL